MKISDERYLGRRTFIN